MKKLIQLLLMFVIYVYPLPSNYPLHGDGLSVIAVEDDVIMGNTLPREGVICDDNVPVYGSPHDGLIPLYLLSTGTIVRLREQSHGADRSWVMIKPAQWIRLSDLCGGQ